MPVKISNRRDLLLQLLGELLYVERRLADDVLARLGRDVRDEELRRLLEEHRDETHQHVERVEAVFRRVEASPSSNLSRPFESALAQHDELAPSVIEPRLADAFHTQAALHAEHWEIAAYRTVLTLAPDGETEALEASLTEEERAAAALAETLERLTRAVGVR